MCDFFLSPLSKEYLLRHAVGICVGVDDVCDTLGISAPHTDGYRHSILFTCFQYEAVAIATTLNAER